MDLTYLPSQKRPPPSEYGNAMMDSTQYCFLTLNFSQTFRHLQFGFTRQGSESRCEKRLKETWKFAQSACGFCIKGHYQIQQFLMQGT